MNFQALISFRVIGLALVGAVLVSLLLSPISEGLGTTIGVVVFFLIWAMAAANTDLVLYCPHCRKRVKIGADVCHHCGRSARA
jgi:hypothetical protein